MSECCASTGDAPKSCPSCATAGSVVGATPVRAHRPNAVTGSSRYCANRICDGGFFLDTDVTAHAGASAIKTAMKAAVAEGLCAYEHLNPSGDYCLPAVHRAVKDAREQLPNGVPGG